MKDRFVINPIAGKYMQTDLLGMRFAIEDTLNNTMPCLCSSQSNADILCKALNLHHLRQEKERILKEHGFEEPTLEEQRERIKRASRTIS